MKLYILCQTDPTLDPESQHVLAESSQDYHAPPPPMAPAPPAPPAAPPLPSLLIDNDGQQSMQVKRINWEKIDSPDSNTIWGKV